jgi:PAS domain S-box-containing protein
VGLDRADGARRRGQIGFSEVSWALPAYVLALFVATGLSIWAAVVARSRRSAPGGPAFSWLMLSVAHWCLTTALHALVPDVSARITIAQVRYLSLATIGPLWMIFASGYARIAWPARHDVRAALWVVPALSLAAAVTNARHGLVWPAITPMDAWWGEALVYAHGPVYWANLAYMYALLALGTGMLVIGVRSYPPPYRAQYWAVVVGTLLPLAGGLLSATRLRAGGGFDLTPLTFVLAGLCFTWGLYHHRLFSLVPVARDMVVESMEDGVVVLDAERRIIDLNAAAERFTGVTPGSVGREISTVISWWTETLAEPRGSRPMPAVVKTAPGPRYFEVRVSAVRDRARRFNGWLVIVRDITSRRQAEAERYALERRVQEQQKSESLTVFAAGVAHDFNNLLTGILGNADLLAMQAPPDSTQRRTAEAIVIGSQRAADLVSKMLAYAGEGRVVSERVDLDSLVREMVDVLSASVSKHCTLVYNSPGPLPMVDADPTQIRQVVLNLIINATEAVDEGGLVTVATGQEALDRDMLSRMTFGADVEPGPYVFIDVVDNGVGMSDETMARMFDPFYSTKETGRGLGLAAVRGIVRSHQAALRVTSAPGQGTRFRVWVSLMPGRQSRPATR